MSKRFHQFRPQPPKRDDYAEQYRRAEQLSKADFGVRASWTRLPKWMEQWLVFHHWDWFDAVESMKIMFEGVQP